MPDKKNRIPLSEFSNELMKKLTQQKRLVRIPKRKRFIEGKILEDAVLVLSDIHVGKINQFPNLETGMNAETYNYEIMIQQANRLIESMVDINDLLSSGKYEINKLYIFLVGDLVDGDIIYQGQRFHLYEGTGQQIITGSKLITDIIQELLKLFDEIDITILGGNHGRMNKKRRDPEIYYNSYEYITGMMIKALFKDEPRVNVVVPQSWFSLRTINGFKYYLHHGDTIRSWMGIPYYGIVRQSKARRTEIPYDLEVIGHFHQSMEIPVSSQSYTVVNGTWIPHDWHSWRVYGWITKPEQRYFGCSEKFPRTWGFNLDLTTKDNR